MKRQERDSDYEILFDPLAIDFLEKQERSIRERIYVKINIAAKRPYHYFEKLAGKREFKLRVGDYRVIADIDKANIHIILIGHRKNVYGR
jgi:mRNA interferase RelE/StbE